jgi:hypothetical protein
MGRACRAGAKDFQQRFGLVDAQAVHIAPEESKIL